MTAPFVGLPTQGEGCAYAAELDSASCGQPPTLHIRVRAEGWGEVALDACDQHAESARSSGSWVSEHAYGPFCVESTLCWLKSSTATKPAGGAS